MLLVRTRLGPSPINGIGLFAVERVPKGTPTWKFVEGFDLKLPREFVDAMGPARDQVLHYAYVVDDFYILCSDDARFFNHSDNPNTRSIDDETDTATRDIEPGEELTCDYKAFDADWAAKLA